LWLKVEKWSLYIGCLPAVDLSNRVAKEIAAKAISWLQQWQVVEKVSQG